MSVGYDREGEVYCDVRVCKVIDGLSWVSLKEEWCEGMYVYGHLLEVMYMVDVKFGFVAL